MTDWNEYMAWHTVRLQLKKYKLRRKTTRKMFSLSGKVGGPSPILAHRSQKVGGPRHGHGVLVNVYNLLHDVKIINDVRRLIKDIIQPETRVFNARAQRSWRRRLWHRPRTPSPSSPSSWRHLRLDTIRARITKFGSAVELDERCSRTKFDVTGYFRSPASGHFVNYFSNFSVQYLRNGST